MRQADAFEQRAGAGFDVALVFLVHDDRRQHHVLQRGQMRVEVEVLEDHADAFADVDDRAVPGLYRRALETDLSALDRFEPVHAAQQGRFAGAAGADEADDLALVDGHADAVQHGAWAETLDHVVELQDRLAHAMAPTRSSRRPTWKRRSSDKPAREIA